jgi:type IV secretory pathway TrbL component
LKDDLVTTAAVATVAAAEAATTAAAAAEATTAAAAAEAATAAAAAEGATSALFLGTSLVDSESAAAEVGAVQLLSGLFGLLSGAHGDERETAGAAGHLVHGDIDIGHRAELAESGAKLVFGGLEGHVTYV